jgi:hypothetical protein
VNSEQVAESAWSRPLLSVFMVELRGIAYYRKRPCLTVYQFPRSKKPHWKPEDKLRETESLHRLTQKNRAA